MSGFPVVSAIIPHAGGREILRRCLEALAESRDIELEAVVVENGSNEIDDSDRENAPLPTQFLHYEGRIGFAGACNRGVDAAKGKYVFLVNNDAFVESDTIATLVDEMDSNVRIGACQPKILSEQDPGSFDYSSGSGGFIDIYGFPFARGRVFDTIEKDNGQYDDHRECFWGAGNALLINRDLYLRAGGLEESFFAHMEEIDLLWRFHLMGYSVSVVPTAVILHLGATTIRADSLMKMYLNHRNNLTMLIRNYSTASLGRYLPVRVIFDFILLTASLLQLNLKRLWAVAHAHLWVIYNLPHVLAGRKQVQRLRSVDEEVIIKKMYPKSVVLQYYIHRRLTWTKVQEALDAAKVR